MNSLISNLNKFLGDKSRTAIIDAIENRVYSFKDIEEISTKVALYLDRINAGEYVALANHHSSEHVLLLIGVIRSGRVVLPLNLENPISLNDYYLDQVQADTILTCTTVENSKISKRESSAIHRYFEILGAFDKKEPLIYASKENKSISLAFTSGSTGKPKGLLLKQESLLNMAEWQNADFQEPDEVYLQYASLNFDVFTQEVFSSVFFGKTLVTINKESRLDFNFICAAIQRYSVSRLFLPTLMLIEFVRTASQSKNLEMLSSLKSVVVAGEALRITDPIYQFFRSSGIDLWNHYGPAEAVQVFKANLGSLLSDYYEKVPIGNVVPNMQFKILREDGGEAEAGEIGELVVSGVQVAGGYLNDTKKSSEVFYGNSYKTGDLVWLGKDGCVYYSGRKDSQIKISGYRIEPNEIEFIIKSKGLASDSRVLKIGDQLIIFLYNASHSNDQIQNELSSWLPSYMVPSEYCVVESFPITKNGKTDNSRLIDIYYESKSFTDIDRILQKHCGSKDVDYADTLKALGVSSISIVKIKSELKSKLNVDVLMSDLLNKPIREWTSISNDDQADRKLESLNVAHSQKTAIVGFEAFGPGFTNVDELWNGLLHGRNFISRLTLGDQGYWARAGVSSRFEVDTELFGLSLDEVERMGPQVSQGLAITYRAMSNSGIDFKKIKNVSVFTSVGNNVDIVNAFSEEKSSEINFYKDMDFLNRLTGNSGDYLASRISTAFGFTGASFSVEAACASGLYSLDLAHKAISSREAEIAIVTASNIQGDEYRFFERGAGLVQSVDGLTRPFLEGSVGPVFTDSVASIVLINYDLAKNLGCRIYSVLEGVSVNNDGGKKSSFLSPSHEGQTNLINNLCAKIGLNKLDVQYYEAHGTGTEIGDSIESDVISSNFPNAKLGSIKSNVGHTAQASGLLGIIKASLSLYYSKVPKSINCEKDKAVSKEVLLENLSLEDNSRIVVTSLGLGGSNGCAALSNSHSYKSKNRLYRKPGVDYGLVFVSSPTEKLYKSKIDNLSLLDPDERNLKEMELNKPRYVEYRSLHPGSMNSVPVVAHKIEPYSSTLIIFSGQSGIPYCNSKQKLSLSLFQKDSFLINCLEILEGEFGLKSSDLLSYVKKSKRRYDLFYDQILTSIHQMYLSRYFSNIEKEHTVVIGNSLGEIAALFFSEALTIEQALRILYYRSLAMIEFPASGRMLSVQMGWNELREYLGSISGVWLASENSSRNCTVSLLENKLETVESVLRNSNIEYRLTGLKGAGHCCQMSGASSFLRNKLKEITFSEFKFTTLSTHRKVEFSKDWNAAEYFSNQLRNPVWFSSIVKDLSKGNDFIVCELSNHPFHIYQNPDLRKNANAAIKYLYEEDSTNLKKFSYLSGIPLVKGFVCVDAETDYKLLEPSKTEFFQEMWIKKKDSASTLKPSVEVTLKLHIDLDAGTTSYLVDGENIEEFDLTLNRLSLTQAKGVFLRLAITKLSSNQSCSVDLVETILRVMHLLRQSFRSICVAFIDESPMESISVLSEIRGLINLFKSLQKEMSAQVMYIAVVEKSLEFEEIRWSENKIIKHINDEVYELGIQKLDTSIYSSKSKHEPNDVLIFGGGEVCRQVTERLLDNGIRNITIASRRLPLWLTNNKELADKVDFIKSDVGIKKDILNVVDNHITNNTVIFYTPEDLVDKPFEMLDRDDIYRSFKSKVIGYSYLLKLLDSSSIKPFRIVLYSSLSGVLGSYNQALYSYAVGYSDNLSRQYSKKICPITSINFGLLPTLSIGTDIVNGLLEQGYSYIPNHLDIAFSNDLINESNIAVPNVDFSTYYASWPKSIKLLDVDEESSSSQQMNVSDFICEYLSIDLEQQSLSFSELGISSIVRLQLKSSLEACFSIAIDPKEFRSSALIKESVAYVSKAASKSGLRVEHSDEAITSRELDSTCMPLSFQQIRWKALVEKRGYGIRVFPLEFDLEFDANRYELALASILDEAPVLRNLYSRDSVVRVGIQEAINKLESFVDARSMSKQDQSALIGQTYQKLMDHRPNLQEELSWNIIPIVVDRNKFILMVRATHLEFDGSSLSIFASRFANFYKNTVKKSDAVGSIDYHDYIKEQKTSDYSSGDIFYRSHFSGVRSQSNLDSRYSYHDGIPQPTSRISFQISNLSGIKAQLKSLSCSDYEYFIYCYSQALCDVFGMNEVILNQVRNSKAYFNYPSAIGPFTYRLPLLVKRQIDKVSVVNDIKCNVELLELIGDYDPRRLIKSIPIFQNHSDETYFSDFSINFTNYNKFEGSRESEFRLIDTIHQVEGDLYCLINSEGIENITGIHLIVDGDSDLYKCSIRYHNKRVSEDDICKFKSVFLERLYQGIKK